MSRVVVRRKPSIAERERLQLQQARLSAPKLSQCMPTARQVCVALAFDANEQLTHAHCQFSTYPPAQAHFVYACPFGDCDGVYDLNAVTFEMLGARSERASGLLVCAGSRAHRQAPGAACGLRASYTVRIDYSTTSPSGHGAEPS